MINNSDVDTFEKGVSLEAFCLAGKIKAISLAYENTDRLGIYSRDFKTNTLHFYHFTEGTVPVSVQFLHKNTLGKNQIFWKRYSVPKKYRKTIS